PRTEKNFDLSALCMRPVVSGAENRQLRLLLKRRGVCFAHAVDGTSRSLRPKTLRSRARILRDIQRTPLAAIYPGCPLSGYRRSDNRGRPFASDRRLACRSSGELRETARSRAVTPASPASLYFSTPELSILSTSKLRSPSDNQTCRRGGCREWRRPSLRSLPCTGHCDS